VEALGFVIALGWYVIGLVGSQAFVGKGYRVSVHSYFWGAMLGPFQLLLGSAVPDLDRKARVSAVPLVAPIQPPGGMFKPADAWATEGAVAVHLLCPNCQRATDHLVCFAPHGIQVRCVFSARPLLGAKRYFLTCSVCDHFTKELTWAQVQSLRGKP
jgi:hypothetical protein